MAAERGLSRHGFRKGLPGSAPPQHAGQLPSDDKAGLGLALLLDILVPEKLCVQYCTDSMVPRW
jgi:hypothetical protein